MEKLIMESTDFVCTKKDREWLEKTAQEDHEVPIDWCVSHSRVIRTEYSETVFDTIESKEELIEFLYNEGIDPFYEIKEVPTNLKKFIDENFILDYAAYFADNYFIGEYSDWPLEKQTKYERYFDHFD